MRSSILVAGAGAVLVKGLAVRGGCDMHISSDGAIIGVVGTISSGQAREGDGVSSTTFHIDGDQIWDYKGRGCWWTRK